MISAADDPVLDQLTRMLVERFAPERIILFGSRGRGDHRANSDYDLIVVAEQATDPAAFDNLVRQALLEFVREVDCIVDTPERFERRRHDVGTMQYVGDREGRVLYVRDVEGTPRRVREPSAEPPESLAEWLDRAESDYTAMEVIAENAPLALDAIAFHAHQSSEKLLKAALVSRHVPPPRTHSLMELLALVSDFRENTSLQSACAFLDSIYMSTRYPQFPMPTEEQVARAVDCARQIRVLR